LISWWAPLRAARVGRLTRSVLKRRDHDTVTGLPQGDEDDQRRHATHTLNCCAARTSADRADGHTPGTVLAHYYVFGVGAGSFAISSSDPIVFIASKKLFEALTDDRVTCPEVERVTVIRRVDFCPGMADSVDWPLKTAGKGHCCVQRTITETDFVVWPHNRGHALRTKHRKDHSRDLVYDGPSEHMQKLVEIRE
jgi:hypothetical protein